MSRFKGTIATKIMLVKSQFILKLLRLPQTIKTLKFIKKTISIDKASRYCHMGKISNNLPI